MRKSLILVTVLAIATTALFGVYIKEIYQKRDLTGPVITSDQERITASITSTEEELLAGLSAIDAVDGDVSDSLILESLQMKEGTLCSATYAACDHANNVTKFSREVELSDYTPSRFRIVGKLRFPIGTSNSKILDCLMAEDCIDGDISNKIRLTGEMHDSSLEGIYDYNISVTNSIQDTVNLPISVEYYTDSAENRLHYPHIFLSDYLVYVEAGSEFHPKRYLDHLELGSNYYALSSTGGSKVLESNPEEVFRSTLDDGTVVSGTIHLSAIRMDTDLDMDTPGTYKVNFSCTTKEGYFGSVQMTVIVV